MITKEDFNEILKRLALYSVKDTQFDSVAFADVRDTDSVAIVHDSNNARVTLGDIKRYITSFNGNVITNDSIIHIDESYDNIPLKPIAESGSSTFFFPYTHAKAIVGLKYQLDDYLDDVTDRLYRLESYVPSTEEFEINVIDSLESQSPYSALSANQGYILDQRLKEVERLIHGFRFIVTVTGSNYTGNFPSIVSYNTSYVATNIEGTVGYEVYRRDISIEIAGQAYTAFTYTNGTLTIPAKDVVGDIAIMIDASFMAPAFYGVSSVVPTTSAELLAANLIELSNTSTIINVGSGNYCEWVAIPRGYHVSSWIDDTLMQTKTYATGATLTVENTEYTVYHSTMVVVQTVGSIVTITKS